MGGKVTGSTHMFGPTTNMFFHTSYFSKNARISTTVEGSVVLGGANSSQLLTVNPVQQKPHVNEQYQVLKI